MTRDEFIKGYCERSDIEFSLLQKWGADAYPCACGEPECEGWAMLPASCAEWHMQRYRDQMEDDAIRRGEGEQA